MGRKKSSGGQATPEAQAPKLSVLSASQKPSVGRIVHYTAFNGVCLAALITGVKPDSAAGLVDLVVFTSLPNVLGNKNGGVQFHFDVASSLGEPTPGYWHWPERD